LGDDTMEVGLRILVEVTAPWAPTEQANFMGQIFVWKLGYSPSL